MIMASLGWQGERTTLAASYARVVSGGGGLNGALSLIAQMFQERGRPRAIGK